MSKLTLGEEVTWTAVAAIGGAIIVLWNIIRYIFTFCSSLHLYYMTKVPLYLLMMRKNQSFTEIDLLYATILVLVMVFSFTSLNRLSFDKARRLLMISLILTGFFSFLSILLMHQLFSDIKTNKYLLLVIVKYTNEYFLPGAYTLVTIGLGASYKESKNIQLLGSTLLGKFREEVIAYLKNEFAHPEEHLEDLFNYQKRISKNNLILRKVYPWFLGFVIFLCLHGATITTHCLIDQDNRYVVADLGEVYIVQDTVIDEDNDLISLKTDSYYIIDSKNEQITIYTHLIDNIHNK